MEKNVIELKEGVKVHLIKTDLFKTNLICLMLTVPLSKEDVTKNTLIPFLLKRGTKNLKDQYQINKKLEEMYGTVYDCGIDKVGDNQLIKLFFSVSKNSSLNNPFSKIGLKTISKIISILCFRILQFSGKNLSFTDSI